MRSRSNSRRSGSSRKSSNQRSTRSRTESKSSGGSSRGKRPVRRSDSEDENSFGKNNPAGGRSDYKKKSFDRSKTRSKSDNEGSSFSKKESGDRGRFKKDSYSKTSNRKSPEKPGGFSSKRRDNQGDSASKFSKPERTEKKSFNKKESGDRGRFKKDSYSKTSNRKSTEKPRGFSSKRRDNQGDSASKFSKPERTEKKPFNKKESGDRGRFKKDSYSKSSNRKSTEKPRGFSSKRRDNQGDSASKFSKPERTEKKSFARKSQPKRYAKTTESVGMSLQSGTEQIRLNKYIANSGVCSRREADELIKMGLVSVNDKAITELGYKVNPGDVVKYEGKTLRAEKPVYILLNKPKGYLTTTMDPQERNTVMHIVGRSIRERIYPVGRLDRNTTGLLLLTNDGDLAEKLSHPSYNVRKIYKVELDRPLTKADFQKVLEGVKLDEGRAMVDDLAFVSDDGKIVGLELHIGWNRVVRRIFEALEYTVVKLDRSVYAGLDKKDLPRGHWRHLTQQELIQLKHYNK